LVGAGIWPVGSGSRHKASEARRRWCTWVTSQTSGTNPLPAPRAPSPPWPSSKPQGRTHRPAPAPGRVLFAYDPAAAAAAQCGASSGRRGRRGRRARPWPLCPAREPLTSRPGRRGRAGRGRAGLRDVMAATGNPQVVLGAREGDSAGHRCSGEPPPGPRRGGPTKTFTPEEASVAVRGNERGAGSEAGGHLPLACWCAPEARPPGPAFLNPPRPDPVQT
jgi:hypothetical protein